MFLVLPEAKNTMAKKCNVEIPADIEHFLKSSKYPREPALLALARTQRVRTKRGIPDRQSGVLSPTKTRGKCDSLSGICGLLEVPA